MPRVRRGRRRRRVSRVDADRLLLPRQGYGARHGTHRHARQVIGGPAEQNLAFCGQVAQARRHVDDGAEDGRTLGPRRRPGPT